MNPRIIELIIEDGDSEAGLDGIALVELPAHEASFEYFSNDEKPTHYVLSDEEIPQVIQMFHAYGEPQGLLEKEGFTISQIKELGKEEFAILADPNAPSAQDTNEVKYRYKYVGPQDKKNRTFCAEMMRANRVFRIEDIQEMSLRNVNPVGPDGYSIFEWRGSYNCRHRFVQLVYKLDTTIINKGSVRKGVIDENDVPGPNTLTDVAKEAGYAPRTGFSATNPDVSGLSPYVDQVTNDVELKPVLASLPLFESKEDAETMALAIGCNGSHPHTYGDKTLYMPCEKHPVEMAGLEDACWEGYEPIGLKPDGSPNCVPIKEEMSSEEEMTFSVFNAEQRLIVGPAMIPDKMIIRRNEITGDIYYVYFTSDTIKKLQQKFMQEKLLDKTNIEHNRKFLNNVDVVESWIIEDEQKDKQQVFGMNYPKGTWMISMKVNDDTTWSKVKDGKLKGFSVQGYFLERAKFSSINNDLLEEIKQILKEVK
jgi:hypothetical protein